MEGAVVEASACSRANVFLELSSQKPTIPTVRPHPPGPPPHSPLNVPACPRLDSQGGGACVRKRRERGASKADLSRDVFLFPFFRSHAWFSLPLFYKRLDKKKQSKNARSRRVWVCLFWENTERDKHSLLSQTARTPCRHPPPPPSSPPSWRHHRRRHRRRHRRLRARQRRTGWPGTL